MPTVEKLVPRALYGGAIEAHFPSRFVDVSNFRPVPDNQEVFQDADKDQNIIFEVVQQSEVQDAEASEFFWKDLAKSNDAVEYRLTGKGVLDATDIPGVPEECSKLLAHGVQVIAKSRDSQKMANRVQVSIVVVRLPSVESELLVTLNTPLEGGSSNSQTSAATMENARQAPQLFRRIASTIKINNWDLFNG